MKVTLYAYGIAKDILQSRKLELDLSEGDNIATLRNALVHKHPAFEKLRSLSFAVSDEYRHDDFTLHDGDEIAVIPPVSGG